MPRRSAAADPADPAPALSRGIALLDLLGRDGPQVLERLAASAALPKSSALRLLGALERLGLAARDPATRRWHACASLVRGGGVDAEHARLRRVLAAVAGESGHAAEYWDDRGDRLVLVERADPEEATAAVRARIGFERRFAEVDACVLVAFACAPAGPRWQARHTQAAERRQVAVARPVLATQVEACRAAGVAADPGINANGVRRFAAPWRGTDGGWRGILAIAQSGGVPVGSDDARLCAILRRTAAG
jgi:DNA-binding IclR family transcriptional regulator